MLNVIHTAATILLENYMYIVFFSILLVTLISYKNRSLNLLAIFLLLLSPISISLLQFLGNIGADSLSEATSFNTAEMYFYVESVITAFSLPSIKIYILYITAIGISSLLVHFFNHFFLRPKRIMVFLLVGVSFIGAYKIYDNLLSESLEYDALKVNFSNKYNSKGGSLVPLNNIDVIVYIGESTSKQHMSSYGYFRNTTPNINKLMGDERLIKYSDVFSTHTHTSSSLLEALSIPKQGVEGLGPETIFQKERITIVELLNNFGVQSHLYSNQSESGTWNYANSIIFQNAKTKIFNKDGHSFGNNNAQSTFEMYDSLFIDEILPTVVTKKGVTFFHSYAGHGDYCKNIPIENRKSVDELLTNLDSKEIYGSLSKSIRDNVECYDSAVKYIDSNLMKFINAIKNNDSAKALVYFSDHGESVYTGNGHDSSRFQLDMLAVPLLVYLNDSALKILKSNNVNFDEKDSLLTLDYVPYLISKILGVDVGEYSGSRYILVRDTLFGKKSIDLNSSVTEDWLYNQYLNSSDPLSKHSCLHRTNNLGKLNQGRLSFDCLEFDVVVNNNGVVYVDHDYPADSKLTMDILMGTANKNKKSVWIDAKNINSPENCLIVAKNINEGDGEVLVEFPSSSLESLDELDQCFTELNESVDYISYYVPTGELLDCQNGNQGSCASLILKLRKVRDSRYFNSLSFDFKGIDFMTSIKPELKKMNYHSWGIKDIKNPKLIHLNMAIISSEIMLNQN
jgi:glucan phosphoethanolaminetransferase (alkaline phosphatase superfamily)